MKFGIKAAAAVAVAGTALALGAGPAAAATGTSAATCTFSGSVVQQAKGTVSIENSIGTPGNTVYDRGYHFQKNFSNKTLSSWTVTQFDNTGLNYGSHTFAGSDLGGDFFGMGWAQKSTKPYVRFVFNATDGQTCTIRPSIVL